MIVLFLNPSSAASNLSVDVQAEMGLELKSLLRKLADRDEISASAVFRRHLPAFLKALREELNQEALSTFVTYVGF